MKLRLFKTEITVSYTLLCMIAVCVILGAFQGFLWCAAAILIHESGHLLAMKKYGYFPERIKISLFEIAVSDRLRRKRRDRENFFIIFFGPFANFVCVPPLYLLYLIGVKAVLPFAAANLSVGLFNCLPALSLDGGQILYLMMCRKYSQQLAERIVNTATFISVFPLAATGIIMLLKSEKNFSLLFLSGYLAASLICRSDIYY